MSQQQNDFDKNDDDLEISAFKFASKFKKVDSKNIIIQNNLKENNLKKEAKEESDLVASINKLKIEDTIVKADSFIEKFVTKNTSIEPQILPKEEVTNLSYEEMFALNVKKAEEIYLNKVVSIEEVIIKQTLSKFIFSSPNIKTAPKIINFLKKLPECNKAYKELIYSLSQDEMVSFFKFYQPYLKALKKDSKVIPQKIMETSNLLYKLMESCYLTRFPD